MAKSVAKEAKSPSPKNGDANNVRSSEQTSEAATRKSKGQQHEEQLPTVPLKFLLSRLVMFLLSLGSALFTIYLMVESPDSPFLVALGLGRQQQRPQQDDGHNFYATLDRQKKQRRLDADLEATKTLKRRSASTVIGSDPITKVSVNSRPSKMVLDELEEEPNQRDQEPELHSAPDLHEIEQAIEVIPNKVGDNEVAVDLTGSSDSNTDGSAASFAFAESASVDIGSIGVELADNFLSTVSSLLAATSFYPINQPCRSARNLNYAPWQPHPDLPLYFPLYATNFVDKYNDEVEYAIIIQHGNSRNGNEYFCSALQSIQALVDRIQLNCNSKGGNACIDVDSFYRKFLIVAPQFLIPGDSCSHIQHGDTEKIDVTLPNHEKGQGTCGGYMVWTNNGWKDGDGYLNRISKTRKGAPSTIYSYDIYNLLVRQFASSSVFPNMKKIVFFGFSAGGQALLRQALLPTYQKYLKEDGSDKKISVRTIISDVSSYPYLDDRRPLPNSATSSFGVPDASWLPQEWSIDKSTGKSWIQDWEKDSCKNYNKWRYGLDELKGYYHQQQSKYEPTGLTIPEKIVRGKLFVESNSHLNS